MNLSRLMLSLQPHKNSTNMSLYIKKTRIVTAILLMISAIINPAEAQDNDWRDNMKYLQYSPRYFGPNAFPMPELRSGRIGTALEAELRGEYHTYKGDRTKDIYARVFIPVAEGQAGLEVSYIIYEYYNMTRETVEERHAAGTSWNNGAHGDVIVSSFFQVLSSDKWADIMVDVNLKTASGNRSADARYTDAAAYWFNMNIGRNLYQSADNLTSIRMQGYAGFYCWMTNDNVHRQNDALTYSAGISATHGNISATADLAGIYGYKNNGDRPMQIRTKLNYEHKKNIVSLRYKHGMKDCLYDSFSIAYIRTF